MMTIFVATIVMLVLDAIYLTLTKGFYNKQVRLIQGSDLTIKLVPTLLVYISLLVGLYYFILVPKRPVMDAVLLGFVIYAVFELTNLAIFDKWSVQAVILDSSWGAILFGLTTFITYKITKYSSKLVLSFKL
jgi:uncharacterized membrane protein